MRGKCHTEKKSDIELSCVCAAPVGRAPLNAQGLRLGGVIKVVWILAVMAMGVAAHGQNSPLVQKNYDSYVGKPINKLISEIEQNIDFKIVFG